MKKNFAFFLLASAFLAGCGPANTTDSGEYNREIGLYPGNPNENFAPILVEDNDTYRNVAAKKAAYHSSAYDYNLTAQLITDDIISEDESPYTKVITSEGEAKKNEKEWLLDQIGHTRLAFKGNHLLLELDMNDMNLHANKFTLNGTVYVADSLQKGYDITVSASKDGKSWDTIDKMQGSGYWGTEIPSRRFPPMGKLPELKKNPSPVVFKYDYKEDPNKPEPQMRNYWGGNAQGGTPRTILYTATLPSPEYRYFKVEGDMPSALSWTFGSWDFYQGDTFISALAAEHFGSSWKSAGKDEEWVYVDLGASAKFDKVVLHWINKAISGKIQTSDDALSWKDVADLPGGEDKKDIIEAKGKGRYVRLLCEKSSNGLPYELSEIQVFGKGGLVAKPAPEIKAGENKQMLNGGTWKLQRASLVKASGEKISTDGFDTQDWDLATVPGTILTSLKNIGAIPEPNYADNQLQISDSYFISDFWYQKEFEVNNDAEKTFLNFDGINWKANIFLNGSKVGLIEGAFKKGKFDVSPMIKKGKNTLAVQIIRNAHPGAVKEQTAFSADANGGILGADNATFHASIGWDWIPTIRGRNIGIWNDVYLTFTGPVSLEDPFVRTELPLPDTTSANVFAEITLKNNVAEQVKGTLKGKYGDASFEQEITLEPNEVKLVKLDAENTPALHLKNPHLWWPKGYGAQHLYDVEFMFVTNGKTSDKVAFKSGVRQMTFDENEYLPSGGIQRTVFGNSNPRRLSLYINGRRFIGFGGNWGFSESNLNYRGREYDIAVKYHADMNFTMIRNWVGQTGDEEFYEACDKYGVMVWQDFWLANPSDGPDPYYNNLFCDNAQDWVKRLRNHPSIALYVGRNEGNPPAELDQYLRTMLQEEHPGIHYISHSAAGVVSGGGPYRALSQKEYFENFGHDKFHSERGMPNVMTYESLIQAMGKDALEHVNTMEDPNAMYGIHDYTLSSAQGADSFNKIMEKMFGKPKDAKQFAEWAQWINYNGYRAIFESRSEHRRGMLLWMSHPAWPSMVWQTYDYYFNPTAAYFGCKKACEPLHIQWNPIREDIEVVNYHAGAQKSITAKAQLFNQDGKEQWSKELTFDIEDDQTVACFPLAATDKLSDTYFIKLTLTDKNGKVVSDNFYCRGKEEDNYKSLLNLPSVELTSNWTTEKEGDQLVIKGSIKNNTSTPALMIRLQAMGKKSRNRILPVLYSDNYFSLLPGEEKAICITLSHADTRGEQPFIEITGFNVK